MICRALLPLTLFVIMVPLASHAWQSTRTPVCLCPGEQSASVSMPDGNGGVIVAWHDSRNGTSNYDIYAQRLDAAGIALWADGGVALTHAADNQVAPLLASDGARGAIVTWTDYRLIGTNAGTDVYAQRINAAGSVLWASDGIAVCTALRHQTLSSIITDGAGGAVIGWTDGRSGAFGDPLAEDVYVQRINSNGAPQWAANGVALFVDSRPQYGLLAVSDGAGGAVVAWDDNRVIGEFEIYAQHINSLGVRQWATNGVMLTPNGSGSRIISDGAAGAIVSFTAAAGSPIEGDIYAQHVNASGAVLWGAGGLGVCTVAGDQNLSMIATDGAGGALVTWEDKRNGSLRDIYAQRIDQTGTPLWGADGVAISLAADEQVTPWIVEDGTGGAIVSWSDRRSVTRSDIYAQRVDAGGAVQWDSDGLAVSIVPEQNNHTTDQTNPSLVVDGSGGAIVTWEAIGGTRDVYAQHLNSDGVATGVSRTPLASMALTDAHPNPFSEKTTMNLQLVADADVVVDVFDVSGARVRHAKLGRLTAGLRDLHFDGMADDGRQLPSGVYFYRVSANGERATRKMVIAR